jgi:hypothetical protein
MLLDSAAAAWPFITNQAFKIQLGLVAHDNVALPTPAVVFKGGMRIRFKDLFPGDLLDHLEEYHVEAIRIGREIKAQRGLVTPNFNHVTKLTTTFFQKIIQKDDFLGLPRATRIVRFGAPPVAGLDSATVFVDLEDSIKWIDQVQTNIEYELAVIDSKRVLWMTLFSAVAAGCAAVLSAAALIVGILTWLATHS